MNFWSRSYYVAVIICNLLVRIGLISLAKRKLRIITLRVIIHESWIWHIVVVLKSELMQVICIMQRDGHDVVVPIFVGGAAVPLSGGAGPHITQCGLGRGLPPYQLASWSIQPFGHNRHGPKIGGLLCPFFGGSGSPCNTVWHGLRPTPVPSGILIHAAVWP